MRGTTVLPPLSISAGLLPHPTGVTIGAEDVHAAAVAAQESRGMAVPLGPLTSCAVAVRAFTLLLLLLELGRAVLGRIKPLL
jgi:hypothetical protein